MKLIPFIAVVFFTYASGEIVKFNNYSVYRFTPKDVEELNILKSLKNEKPNPYDFWTEPRSIQLPVDIMVPPERKNEINKMILEHKMNFNIMIEDVQKQIVAENRLNSVGKRLHDWTSYHTLEEINDWLESIVNNNPSIATLVVGGKSYEGRDILGVKISYSPENKNNSVWIDSQMHAREWITAGVSTYILNEVLTSTDPIMRSLAESHDWYFFPVINPDGFVYTHTTNRLWRKTRNPYGSCFGTDPNRNWGYKWNEGGSTNDPCDETYAGPYAFSDVESKSLSEYMSTIAEDLVLFVTFHSYSQLLLLPYGHTTEHLDNYNVTYPVGLKAAASLAQRYGTKYTVGDIAETIYVATGSNMDWLKAYYHVPFAYAYELRDTGKYGFLLPADQIIPTSEETLDSIVTILQEADKILN